MENITLVLIMVFMVLSLGLLIIFYFKNQKTENIENAFKVIAAQVLEEKNSSLTKDNIERVNVVLEPFKEQIKELNHQISDLKKLISEKRVMYDPNVDQKGYKWSGKSTLKKINNDQLPFTISENLEKYKAWLD